MSVDKVLRGESRFYVGLGDNLPQLKEIPSNSIDAVSTDPPSGTAFMSAKWDTAKGGRDAWIAWMANIARECLRVTKPGGHAVVWGLPRTAHWVVTAWEDAGWEARDCVVHLQSEGFPKNHNISKMIDKMAGDAITTKATDAAKQWEGWGTALKPAAEFWWLLRKPCDQPTVAQNVLTHGTGALNIDGTRVPTNPNDPILESEIAAGRGFGVNAKIYGKPGSGAPAYDASKGRHTANLVVSHHPECNTVECHPDCQAAALDRQSGYTASVSGGVAGWQDQYVGGELAHPVDRTGYDDAGGASRFFNTFRYVPEDNPAHESFIYTPKPSQSERHEGLPEDGNTHISVKSIALMSHLVTLITPPGGVVLDPFTGSGSTGVAAMYHSPTTRFIGMEQDPTYHGIASARLTYHLVKSMGGVPNPFATDAPVVEEPPVTLASIDDLFSF